MFNEKQSVVHEDKKLQEVWVEEHIDSHLDVAAHDNRITRPALISPVHSDSWFVKPIARTQSEAMTFHDIGGDLMPYSFNNAGRISNMHFSRIMPTIEILFKVSRTQSGLTSNVDPKRLGTFLACLDSGYKDSEPWSRHNKVCKSQCRKLSLLLAGAI